MPDLFSVVIQSALSWGISRLLDAAVDCRCGHSERPSEICNVDYNQFRCPSCANALAQYVNATDHTVSRSGAVVAAALSGIHWPAWRDDFLFYYDLDVINSKYESVVVEASLSEFRGSVFHEYQALKKPTYEYSHWGDTWISIPDSRFPEHACTIALDLKVYNTWGDLLDLRRKLLEYPGK